MRRLERTASLSALDIVSILKSPSSRVSDFSPVFGSFVDVLGELEDSQVVLANQRPLINVVADGKPVETIHKDAVDHIMIQEKLTSGAVASISVRIFHAVA
jgi:hypothetical protein